MRMSTPCTSFCPKLPFMSLEVVTSVGAPSTVGQLGRVIPAQAAHAAGSMNTSGRFERDPALPLYAAGFAVFRGSGDLAWAKVTVDRAFVDEVLGLQTRVVTRGLLHCAASWTAQGWDGARPVEGTLASVHVNEHSCWLRTHPQNQELAIETVRMDIAELIDAISTGHGTTPVLWYRGALVYGDARGFGLLKRLIACGACGETQG
jgi:hypothetical protein